LKLVKQLIFTVCVVLAALFALSCDDVSETEALDNLVLQNVLTADASQEKNNLTNDENINEEPIMKALQNGDSGFDDVFISDGAIWHFKADGTIDAYENESKVYSYTYSLEYEGADNANKYIELLTQESVRKFRFKKITTKGFDIVFTDVNGNDAGIYTFIKSSFYAALFNKRPYFTETFYESNAVWNFKPDGTLKTYDTNGEVYNYMYNLEYVETEDGKYENFLVLTGNAGKENEIVLRLKILSFVATQFSLLNVSEDSDGAGAVITFTKQ